MASYPEQFIYGLFNFLPYSFLLLYPFRTSFRYSNKKTALIFLLFSCIEMFAFMGTNILEQEYGIYIAVYLSPFLLIERYLFVIAVLKTTHPGKVLFILLIIKNFADACSVVSFCMEDHFFYEEINVLYNKYNTLCLVIVQAIFYYPMMYFIQKNFTKEIRDKINSKMWKYLWLIPLLFYFIWVYTFYFNVLSAFEMAIRVQSSIFIIVLLGGEMMIYHYLAKLIQYNSDVTHLEYKLAQVNLAGKYYKSMQKHIEEIRTLKHDMRHLLRTYYELADNNENEQLKALLKEQIDAIPSTKTIYSTNPSLNFILVYYAEKCRTENIDFDIKVTLPEVLPTSDIDTTVLFGNLLENAYDATSANKTIEKKISFKAANVQNQLIFIIENTYENDIVQDVTGHYLSTKHEGFGLGVSSSKQIVEKNGGSYQIEHENNLFRLSIILPQTTKADN